MEIKKYEEKIIKQKVEVGKENFCDWSGGIIMEIKKYEEKIIKQNKKWRLVKKSFVIIVEKR